MAESVTLLYDKAGRTLNIWIGDPDFEHTGREAGVDWKMMLDEAGGVLGFEILNFEGTGEGNSFTVETTLYPVSG